MRAKRTLILLANEKAARFLVNDGVGHGLSELSAFAASDFDDTDTRFSDRPGRQNAAPGMARHGFEPHTPERDQERMAFIAHVVERTAAAWTDGFDRLVVVAAPRMLGALRQALPDDLKAAVVAELDKDLLKTPILDLPGHLDTVLAV